MHNVYAADFSQEELSVLNLLSWLKPGYRQKALERAGLGDYTPDNPHIESLVKKGLVKIQGGKNIVLDKAKAKEVMSHHPIPDKYRRHLENPGMDFNTAKSASLASRVAARFIRPR